MGMISQVPCFSDILNISKIDAKLGYGQLTAGFLKLNYCDYIYISVVWVICDILGYHRFSKRRFFADYLNVSATG